MPTALKRRRPRALQFQEIEREGGRNFPAYPSAVAAAAPQPPVGVFFPQAWRKDKRHPLGFPFSACRESVI